MPREFLGCSVVRTPHFHYQDPCSVSSRRTKVPQAMQCRPKKKKRHLYSVQSSLSTQSLKISLNSVAKSINSGYFSD